MIPDFRDAARPRRKGCVWSFGAPARLASCLLLLAGCGDEYAPDLRQPEGWDAEVRVPEAEDHDPDPDVVEVHLEARLAELEIIPGLVTEVWTYDGMLPGPTIRAKRGDRVVVKFRNSLPESTTIHWHGLRIPAAMDGTEHNQLAIAPGESFQYEFTVPDAGTFWYHPHIRSSAQVGAGLYGAFIVEDPQEPFLGDDLPLVLSDISIEEDGSLMPADSNGWFGDYFGREGSTLLVNGRVLPTVKGRIDVPQRWRVVNAARSRYFRFRVPGQSLVRVGNDGGLIERPWPEEEITLAPGERAEIHLLPTASEPVVIPALDGDRYNLPTHETEPKDLMRFELAEEPPGHGAPALPSSLRDIAPVDIDGATEQAVEFMEGGGPDGPVLGINGETDGTLTLHAKTDTVEVWTVTNTTPFDHPFHLHGFFFQVLDVDGEPPSWRSWRDTVNVDPGAIVRIAIPFDDRAGMWMFHCHILDHADLGMMAMLHLMP